MATVQRPSVGRTVLATTDITGGRVFPAVVLEVDEADPTVVHVVALCPRGELFYDSWWARYAPALDGTRQWCYPPREERTMEVAP